MAGEAHLVIPRKPLCQLIDFFFFYREELRYTKYPIFSSITLLEKNILDPETAFLPEQYPGFLDVGGQRSMPYVLSRERRPEHRGVSGETHLRARIVFR